MRLIDTTWPPTHCPRSVVFTRGNANVGHVHAGGPEMQPAPTTPEPNTEKRFYLQYAFPPSSVGETGRTGAGSKGGRPRGAAGL